MVRPGSLATAGAASMLFLAGAIGASLANHQQPRGGPGYQAVPTSPVDTLSPEQRKQLIKRLNAEPFSPIKFENQRATPLAIADAKMRSTLIEGPTGNDARPITDHLMDVSLQLASNSDVTITGFALRFTRPDGNTFFMRPPVKIGAHKQLKFDILAMAIPGDPGDLQIKLTGVQFDDFSAWGEYRRLPLGTASSPAGVTAASHGPERSPTGDGKPVSDDSAADSAQKVDRRPRAMNTVRPFYTQEGRSHWVNGVVHLRVLVGSDGKIAEVRVRNALPEWLTEEAIRAAMRLTFLPATKDNQPVPCWIPLDITFSLL